VPLRACAGLEALVVQLRIDRVRARLSRVQRLPCLDEARVVRAAAERARPVPGCEGGRLVEEEELGELAGLEQLAPVPALELELARDPPSPVVAAPDAPVGVVQAAPVPVDKPTCRGGDQLAQWSDTVLAHVRHKARVAAPSTPATLNPSACTSSVRVLKRRKAHNLDGSDGEQYWRERAEQLEHALSSRISVEQAKGILGERLGLDMSGAFVLLRYAARGERMKLHVLAQQVVDNDATPDPVIRALARHASVLGRTARGDRVAQTERFFRAVNEEIANNDGHGTTLFLCECGNPGCTEGFELTAQGLRHLHAEKGLFVVLPGHEIADLETVVDRHDGYLVVRRNTPED
jgi:hypothetical protein